MSADKVWRADRSSSTMRMLPIPVLVRGLSMRAILGYSLGHSNQRIERVGAHQFGQDAAYIGPLGGKSFDQGEHLDRSSPPERPGEFPEPLFGHHREIV